MDRKNRKMERKEKRKMSKEERYRVERYVSIELDMQPLRNGNIPLPCDAVRFAESEMIPAVMCVTDVPAIVSFRDESCAGQRLRNGLVRYIIRGSIVLSDIPASSQEEAERAADRMASEFMSEKNCLLSYSIVSATIGREKETSEEKTEIRKGNRGKKEEGKRNAGQREDVAR